MKEVGRRCDRCGFGWYAVKPKGKAPKPRWFDETGAFWTDGQARMARLVGNHDRSQRAWLEWGKCTTCGSIKVSTDVSKAFRPTNAVSPIVAAADESPAPPATTQSGVAQIQPAKQPPSSSATTEFWSKAGAFHGQHWRLIWAVVFTLAPFGAIGSSEGDIYGDSTMLNVLKFAGVLIACWVVAGGFWNLHWRRRSRISAPRSGGVDI